MALILRFSSNYFSFLTVLLTSQVLIYLIWAVFLALALISIMFSQVLVERLSGLPEAASRYSWIFTSLLSSDMLVQVFFLFSYFLFRYDGSGILPIDFPGQLFRAAVAIFAKFCNCLLFFVYILFLSLFVFLPWVSFSSPMDRHEWQMIWSLPTICTFNPVTHIWHKHQHNW